MPTNSNDPRPAHGVSRRRAIKTGTALVAGVSVWAEPTIKGLARRPAYAAGGSAASSHTVDAVSGIRIGLQQDPLPRSLAASTDGLVAIVLTGPLPGQHAATGAGGTYTVTAVRAGCVCTFDGGAVRIRRSATSVSGTAAAGAASIDLVWPMTPGLDVPPRFDITSALTITCV